ncbi:MAG: recombinase zinc beta ribbon domain-containing protein, partial [Candidatus Saccharimonadales bacterium]
LKTRRLGRHKRSNSSPFAAKIICGECGGFYGSKVWHSADQYRTHIWQCNRKYKDKTFCSTPHIREDVFKQDFIEAFNQILGDKEPYIRRFEELLPSLADTSALEKQRDKLSDEMKQAELQLRRCIEENARNAQDQDEYDRRYNELADKLKLMNTMVAETDEEISELKARKEKICRFLGELQKTDALVTEFEESLWHATVDSVKVGADKTLIFIFRDGTEISIIASKSN